LEDVVTVSAASACFRWARPAVTVAPPTRSAGCRSWP